MEYSSANRATWQCLRTKYVNPAGGSGSTQGSTGYVDIGRWLGAWMPFTGFARDLPGAPIVDIDAYAFLPPEAGSIVRAGDRLRNLDQMTMWEVKKVFPYPDHCHCAIKRDDTFPVT